MSDEWMKRTTQHAAIKHYFDFMVDAGDHSKCIATKNTVKITQARCLLNFLVMQKRKNNYR